MGSINGGAETPVGVRVHADLVHAGGEIGFVQDAQHALFAVDGGQKRDAQVKVAAGHLHPHAAVLGQTAFGNVEAAHDLQAGNQADRQIFWGRRFVEERAVDAVAQADHPFKGFDVNVAGA